MTGSDDVIELLAFDLRTPIDAEEDVILCFYVWTQLPKVRRFQAANQFISRTVQATHSTIILLNSLYLWKTEQQFAALYSI